MTWHQAVIVRILLIITRMLADSPALQDELRNLSNHITAGAPSRPADA